MAIKFDSVKVGDVLYDCHKRRMGNTTVRAMGTWTVKIVEKVEGGCWVSWNGNARQFYGTRKVEKLRRSPIKVVEKA